MRCNLKDIKKVNPDLMVLDVSSGIRYLQAVRWLKRKNKKILLVVQEQRLHYAFSNPLLIWLVRKAEKYLIRNADIIFVNSRYSSNLAVKKGARKAFVS